MLLRRITEHVKTQNWLAVGIDFAIVVVGVFIGIQVSNWNDALGDREVANKHLGNAQFVEVTAHARLRPDRKLRCI